MQKSEGKKVKNLDSRYVIWTFAPDIGRRITPVEREPGEEDGDYRYRVQTLSGHVLNNVPGAEVSIWPVPVDAAIAGNPDLPVDVVSGQVA